MSVMPPAPANAQKIPLVALCGFLGSGKTSLLRRWRRDPALSGTALIVNDLSDLGVDAELLSDEDSNPEPGRLVDRVAALHGRHARPGFVHIGGFRAEPDFRPGAAAPQVLCESTGAARPWPLIAALTQDDRFVLRHFIATVDALSLHRDFADGRVLTGEDGGLEDGGLEDSGLEDPALTHAAEILAEQILFANVVVLTKTDVVPRPAVDAQVKLLQRLVPQATIALSGRSGLKLHQLDKTPAPKLADLEKRAEIFGLKRQSPVAEDVEATVFADARPFHPQRLFDVCQNQLGTGIYRTKGFLWLASRPADVLLWQQSGSQISLELTNVWAADAVENRFGKLVPSEVQFLKDKLAAAHPTFGDRKNELTIIGLPDACEVFTQALTSALCTEAEVAAWQAGATFADPWPATDA